MEPHRFEQDGEHFEASFERTPDGWVARIRRERDDTIHVVAFPQGVGFDPEDERGSLIAGCESIAPRLPSKPPTRH